MKHLECDEDCDNCEDVLDCVILTSEPEEFIEDSVEIENISEV